MLMIRSKKINADVGDMFSEHLGVRKCTGERPSKVLHGKGTDCRGRPGCYDLDDHLPSHDRDRNARGKGSSH